MTRLVVNSQERLFDRSTAKTWGDLLDDLDERCQAEGHVVTAVRLDGVDEPSFRRPEARTVGLTALAVVDVDTTTPGALVTEAIDEGCAGLDRLCDHAVTVGTLFRGLDPAAANRALVDLAQGLQAATTLLAAIGSVVQGGRPEGAVRSTDAVLGELAGQLEALIAAQQQGDWVTVADIVEHDIQPALRACRSMVEDLASAHVVS
jgi:hypothetical protein